VTAAATQTPVSSRPAALALSAAVVSGALVAGQQRLNGELKTELNDALLTALVSFLTGLVLIAAVVLARPTSRAALGRVRDVPWLQRLGGLGGATLVAVGAAAAPEIGVALLTVGIVAGQTSGGLLVDRLGLGPGGAHAVTLPRLVGAGLCLAAVGLSVSGQTASGASPLLLALVVLSGLLIAVQQAINGRVRETTGDAGVATLVNFVLGTAALAAGVAVDAAIGGLDIGQWPGIAQWFLYLGGPIGVAFVAVAAVAVRIVGVLRFGLAAIAGQLVGALLLDVFSPVSGTEIGALTVVGVLLTLLAVAVAGVQRRRPA